MISDRKGFDQLTLLDSYWPLRWTYYRRLLDSCKRVEMELLVCSDSSRFRPSISVIC